MYKKKRTPPNFYHFFLLWAASAADGSAVGQGCGGQWQAVAGLGLLLAAGGGRGRRLAHGGPHTGDCGGLRQGGPKAGADGAAVRRVAAPALGTI